MKSARLNLRIPEELNAEVVEAAEAGGYRYVSTWVEEAIREKIERDQEGQHPQIPPTIGSQQVKAASGPDTPVLPPKQEVIPGSDPRVCPRAGNHRAGIFCKGCNRVITKG